MIDTFNQFMVGGRGDKIVIPRLHVEITKEQAINLAAWLVCLADISPDHATFKETLKAIENS